MSHHSGDAALRVALWGTGIFSGLILVAIVAFTFAEGAPVLTELGIGPLVSDGSWHPTSGAFGIIPMIVATVVVSLLAIVIAAPIGIAIAIVEQFYLAQRSRVIVRRLVEVMSGIPSVIFGLWGLVVLVPYLAQLKPPGTSLLAAAIVLALMIVPTVALFSAIAFERAGDELRRAATAVGLSRATLVCSVAMPLVAGGVGAGVLLALARAVGETMVVLMVAGNVPNLPTGLLEPVRTLTANMALEMAYAEGLHRAALFFSGVLVMAIALALVIPTSSTAKERAHGR